jgi:hypothetical protein
MTTKKGWVISQSGENAFRARGGVFSLHDDFERARRVAIGSMLTTQSVPTVNPVRWGCTSDVSHAFSIAGSASIALA